MAASRNRIALTAASWNAHACVAHTRAALTDFLAPDVRLGNAGLRDAWSRLDEIVRAAPPPAGLSCDLSVQPVGSRLDVNASEETQLARLLREGGMRPVQAESAAAALADWKDADSIPRALGAERPWYQAQRRPEPSNRPFAHVRELRLVRGLEVWPALDSLLEVEPGPVALSHARPEILALLPGFTLELVQRVIDARRRDEPVRSFHELSQGLSPDARETLERSSASLPALVLLEPMAWVMTARSTAGKPPVTVAVEVRFGRAGVRAVAIRRRSWIQ